jgi:O-acetylhomoserine/O-acetylserine sulfhydrylase-like pyridoxal-dependent enzyme
LLGSRDLSEEQQRLAGMAAGTVRLSVGLEDTDDLIEDIQQALVVSQGR